MSTPTEKSLEDLFQPYLDHLHAQVEQARTEAATIQGEIALLREETEKTLRSSHAMHTRLAAEGHLPPPPPLEQVLADPAFYDFALSRLLDQAGV